MIEKTILSHLIFNEAFARKTLPFLKDEYFQQQHDKVVYKLINEYVIKYNSPPTKEVLFLELNNKDGLSENVYKESKRLIEDLQIDNTKIEWLLDSTEKFCQEKAIYNAIMASIKILDDKTGSLSAGSIPTLLSDALGVSFDVSIGHDYFANADDRFDFYHRKEEHIPFDLDYFNVITKGGLVRKTLNIALAGTGVGKSLFMCHCASNNLTQGKNVLYITMEMAEEKIAERIDANLLNVTVDELSVLPKDAYDKKIARIKEKTVGKLIVKEYPTASAGSAHFRHLINELRIKRNFVPDIIYIDYLNICSSSRIKTGSNVNSYTYIKAIAEELRGLAVEFNVPVVSATQTTRCLAFDTIVTINGNDTTIDQVKVGDKIQSNESDNIVTAVYHTGKQKAYKITLSNGQKIVCSGNHIFPTADSGDITINNGLKPNMYLQVKQQ